MGSVEFKVVLDDEKVYEAIQDGEGTVPALEEIVNSIKGRANAMSAGYRTKKSKTKGVPVGDKQPIFDGNVERHGRSQVGLVWTANYAAKKHNLENNTLVKSIG